MALSVCFDQPLAFTDQRYKVSLADLSGPQFIVLRFQHFNAAMHCKRRIIEFAMEICLESVAEVENDAQLDLLSALSPDRLVDFYIQEFYWVVPDTLLLPLGKGLPGCYQEARQLQQEKGL